MNTGLRLAFLIAAAIPFAALAQQSFNQGQPQYPPAGQAPPPQGQYGNAPPPGAYPPPAGQGDPYAQDGDGGPSMPAQGGYGTQPMPAQGGWNAPPGAPGQSPAAGAANYGGAQPSANPAGMMQAELRNELQDFGIPPRAELQPQMHGPTPTSIPGGRIITSDRLLGLYQQGQQNGLLVFDVLGSGYTLPMAQNAVGAAEAGSFNDQVQQQFGQFLQQVTQGRRERPMVFYCQGPHCWMSYNAALRAIHLGYTQVYWYRGGIEAWQRVRQMAAGMPGQQGGMPASGNAMPAGYPQNVPPNGGQPGWPDQR